MTACAVGALLGSGALFGCDDSHSTLPPHWPQSANQPASVQERASSSAATGSPACGKAGAKTGVLAQHVQIFGKNRSYTLVVPSGYSPTTSYPLVYVLHGQAGTARKARSAIDLESIAGGRAIFRYPDGQHGSWDLDSPTSKNADVALFDATLAISTKAAGLQRIQGGESTSTTANAP
jgi:hypothetical protein